MRTPRNCLLVLAGLTAAWCAGCHEDEEIRHYQVPKQESRPLNRLLGAIFPQRETSWFFKLVGPAQLVDRHVAEFDRFVNSIRFLDKADQPVAWTVPDNWRKGPKSQSRYATFYLEPKGDAVELTVTQSGGSISDNVSRWRQQLELPPMSQTDVAEQVREITVDGVRVTKVDMKGTGSGKTSMGNAPFAGHPGPVAASAPPRSELRYQAPAGWEEVPATGAFRKAAFRITEGGKSAEVTIIPLSGEAGGLLANVGRWRGEIGLDPKLTQEQLDRELGHLSALGESIPYVDLVGPEHSGRPAERTLAVAVPHGGSTWFVKMRGAADLVAKQKPAFQAFVKSIRFDGDEGGKR